MDMALAARAMTVRVELGIQQGRHSTLNSYCEKLLFLLTGNFGRKGTNNLHGWLQPLIINPPASVPRSQGRSRSLASIHPIVFRQRS